MRFFGFNVEPMPDKFIHKSVLEFVYCRNCLAFQDLAWNISPMDDVPAEKLAHASAVEILNSKHASRLTIECVIGKGSFGTVFLAVDGETNTKVALKICPFWSKEMQSLLFSESLILSLVDSPYFPKLYYCESYNRLFIMVLEYVPGRTLFNLLEKRHRLDELEIITISNQLLDALEYLHANSIVHRDIKLENVIVADNLSIKICDFGFSRFFDKGELINDHCGSMYYCSPEVARGESYRGVENDIWTLGVCILMMCIGPEKYYDLVETQGLDILSNSKALDQIVDSNKLKVVLGRIFQPQATKRADIREIRSLLHGKMAKFESRPIYLIDPAVLNQMEMMGYGHRRVIERIKNDNFSEKYIYQLVFNRIYRRASIGGSQPDERQRSLEAIARAVEHHTGFFCCSSRAAITLYFTQHICIEDLLRPSKLKYLVTKASRNRMRLVLIEEQLTMEFQVVGESQSIHQMHIIVQADGESEYVEIIHHIVRSFIDCDEVHQVKNHGCV